MNKREHLFIQTVWDYYHRYGRHHLPWRQTTDPYQIMVSEVMLQQTQVDRVIPKYQAFIATWPNVETLSSASLGEVLRAWQGLGYNRRAKALHQCAKTVVAAWQGRFPAAEKGLLALPGVGPYTAGAILTFAYNQPVVLLETNIKSALLWHFFNKKELVTESEIKAVATKVVATDNPREWYSALMDYGAYIKKTYGNQNQRTTDYVKQSVFAGSDRQIRGAILRAVSTRSMTSKQLEKQLSAFASERILKQVTHLEKEGMIERVGKRYQLPE